MDILTNSYLYVDLDILRGNLRAIQGRLGGAKLIPVLKSDAYGLGLAPVARAAAAFGGIDCFAVAHVSEGLELRQAGIEQDILIIGSAYPCQLPAAVAAGLTLTAARPGFLAELDSAAAELGTQAKVQIKLDTGLHRIGVEPGPELDALLGELGRTGRLQVTGTFSHFADTDDRCFTSAQFDAFRRGLGQMAAAGVDPGLRHISCSAGSELYPEYNMDAARIGRGLFMDNPTHPLGNIGEVASWRCQVTAVKRRRAGDALGYGRAVVLERDADVASIGVGYGDGLNTALAAAHAPVLIGGRRCALLYCSMDQSLVDVSGAGCAVGDEVTVFGRSADGGFISAQETAALIGGNEGCGLTAALPKRVTRLYSD